MNPVLKHWAGTILVAALAGFVIFGLLHGQEILNDFLKSEPIDANLERGELLEQIQYSPILFNSPTPAPKLPTSKPQPINTFLITPTPVKTQTPSPIPTITPTPVLTLTPSSTPFQTFTPNPTTVPTSSPESTPTPTQQQAQCGLEQVDINLASKEELLKIKHIGSVRADELITLRPFSSVDDMTRISGIGPTRLKDIKDEGIACVE